MKIEYVGYWDRFFITPAISIVWDPTFVGYKYLSISWLKHSIEISWGHVKEGTDE
jgi:hypothetical protein